LWVVGGNTFVLARAMQASGFATVGTDLVVGDQLTYAGYSAGVCVITPDLEGVHLMDEPLAIPTDYPVEASAATLGWVPWRVVPHWRSDHGESAAAELAVEYLLKAGLPFLTLQDGHAIVVNGDQTYLVDRT
jgi:dipeptidase E